MDLAITALLLPAALVLGAPHYDGAYEKGLFCESPALVEQVVAAVDRGANPRRAVAEINRTLDRAGCIYAVRREVLATTVRWERNVAANGRQYGIYQMAVTAMGHQSTEIGDLVWKYSAPKVMYTLRKPRFDGVLSH